MIVLFFMDPEADTEYTALNEFVTTHVAAMESHINMRIAQQGMLRYTDTLIIDLVLLVVVGGGERKEGGAGAGGEEGGRRKEEGGGGRGGEGGEGGAGAEEEEVEELSCEVNCFCHLFPIFDIVN